MKELLIIGGGGIGERHIRAFLATKKVNISLCEVDEKKIELLKSKYSLKQTFDEFEEVPLEKFDAVLIAVPAHLHIPLGLKCASASIPFLLEKPISVKKEGIGELKEVVEKKKLICGVAYVRRSLPSFKKLKELVEEKIIGNLRLGRFFSGQDYRKYRQDYQKIYYAKESSGGGCILDAASHIMNLAQWYFGRPRDVVSFYDRMEFENVECEDTSLVLVRFQGKSIVDIFVNQFQRPNITEIELIGNKGNLRYVTEGHERQIHRILFCNSDDNKWEELASYSYLRDDPYVFQAEEFLKAIEEKKPFVTTIEEAEITLDICLEAKKSQKQGRIINLNFLEGGD